MCALCMVVLSRSFQCAQRRLWLVVTDVEGKPEPEKMLHAIARVSGEDLEIQGTSTLSPKGLASTEIA